MTMAAITQRRCATIVEILSIVALVLAPCGVPSVRGFVPVARTHTTFLKHKHETVNNHEAWTAEESRRYGRLFSTATETSDMMKQMREDLAENEDANLMMQAMRGQNINDDDSAVVGLQMALVDVGAGLDASDVLPFEYDPQALITFFGKRPMAAVTRISQLLQVGGGVALNTALDAAFNRLN
eukprot:CAMPEP_0198288554 /NCGR_PEP_ID=MMETSP1449-20131203/7015_1 /TAXON_ID=420275 /ORGANISM="Attheya septentrionalis, Strain CCMP2084" /LENGTH=182 /DNA_ID=CAMNT_0043986715 /DNA_START=183 /DNA_END=728 /DNA_ORIENTATION=+